MLIIMMIETLSSKASALIHDNDNIYSYDDDDDYDDDYDDDI